MNKKEILMICLIICFIFSLQAVSAADVELNTTDDNILAVQIDDTVSVSNDLSSYSLPENNSIVRGENDGAGSFSELQAKIDNDDIDVLILDKNYTYDDSSDSGLKNGIVISKDIYIVGNGFTIDALSSARIFNITTGSKVTLNGITFVNGGGASVDYGGSIYSTAQDLTIYECTFDGSYATEDGGAMFISGDGCKLYDSTFINNAAGDDGGAINWNGNDGTIYNTTFTNNTGISNGDSSSRGGAICLTGNDVIISKSTFTSDHVSYSAGSDITKIDGGALFITGNTVKIADSTFTDCTADNNGGAIYALGNNVIIDNSTFTDNNATEDGGAIYIAGENCKLSDSTFTENVAGDDGGAIYWEGNGGNIYNISCTNNLGICIGDSNSKGGTICLTSNDTTINRSTFTSSHVIHDDGSDITLVNGGALLITGNNVNVIDSTFTDCTADNDGGAIYALGNNVIITNSTFTDNNATEDGGAIYIAGESCQIYDSTFSDNNAGDDGGAIYWEGANGIIDGSVFENNMGLSTGNPSDPSTSKGGTISVIGDNVDISNCNISGGVTKNRDNANTGGAVFITGNDVDIDNCNFKDCSAEGSDGGTIYIIGSRTTVSNSNISDSTARAGGAIYIDGVYASIINSSFTDTFAKTGSTYDATNLGGAIYIKGNYATISGSDFDESAAYSGGIIYLQGNYCNVSDSSFNGGSASNDGGAMYSTGSYSTVTNSNFTHNAAQGNGGAMYWYGGANSKYNDIIGCLFEENIAYARSSSNTRGGGAIYWSEGGAHDSIKDSKFIKNSVQSDNKADGGAILWDRSNYVLIDGCTFDGDYVSTTSTGNVWVQGGALYLRVDSKAVINNTVFVNCSSDKEAGALYVQSKSNLDPNNPILIENTKFISNVAEAIAPNVYGGGAVQVKECNNIFFTNVEFINNTANNGGALSVYNTAEPVKLIDCVFIGNNATQNGGSIWFNKRLYLYNITISDSHAENFGGGMYNENAELIHNNITFINNTALNGGGVYWNRNSYTIHDMVFLNNTALENGGAIYIAKGGNILQDVNMTNNKAFSGSAIYSTAAFTLTNAYLIENQANSSSLTFDSYDESTGKIVLLFKGRDKYLNAIYVTSSNRPTCTNVTYWNENGVANTGSSAVTLPNAADPTPEAGQNITVGIYDDNGNLLNPDDQYFITDKNGKIYLDLHDVVPSVPEEKYGEIYVEAILTNDDYYTIIKLTSRAPSSINASATNTTYHSNSTLSVNVTHGATGNVSVYLNDTFIGNITLDNSMGSMEISTLIEDKYLPAGNHTLTFVYNGNAKYDKSNTTAILEIGKITPTLLVDVTGIEYNLVVNVTVMDGEYNISDATGNVTIEVADRTATIYLANGQGMTVIYGLRIGNYTVNATYNGDNNYYNVTNSTYGNVTEKVHTVIVLDVDNNVTYFINETVPIKVTVLPNAEGNITLYINGEPHVLTLQTVDNTTFVEFNATELKDGVNYVFATYEGTDMYGPSWAEDSFNVTKYNATVLIETDNITRGDTEVINFTLPEDATGILNVTVNGTPYYIEIINGTATLPISGLNVGVYNVTVTFNGDKKYYNATNSTLFNVSKATPSIIVSVDNITYGEDAIVIVTVPDDAKGNVTIKLNETIVFTQEPIDGQATFTLKNLKASNYTIVATFNGNENYTNASNSTNFTVFKATPELNVTVEDIYYGDAEHIIIKVNADGNVTVKVNGTETILNITSAGNETYVYDLAVGNYPVEVTFNGNENYTEVTVTKDFNVYQVNTTLDVDVHDIVVWDKESINVTLAKNTTGNVIININGVSHTVPITNGTAQLNLTNLTVGHKVVWVFYDGDRNYTANRTMAEFDVGQRTPNVNVTALNVTVNQEGKITINIPANATGFVVLSGNFTKNPIYVDEFTDGVAEISVDDLAVGTYSVHIKYYGDALDNYTVAENDTTFTVGKINTTVTIDVENVTYGNDTVIVVTVPEGVTGNITLKINDTTGKTITLPIVNGEVTWTVDGLAAGNYTVNVTYNGNDDYNINNTESAKFEVKKADPGLDFTVDGVIYENANVTIFINDEIHGKVVNVTVDGVEYTNVSVDDEFITQILTDLKPYTIIVEYGGNENFTDAIVEKSFTPSKVTDYEINVTAMNITVNDDEIITVEVPDHVDDVVIWVNGTQYRNNSFTGNKATFNVTGLKEGVYTVTASVNDDEFEHKNVTTIFTVSKTYPSINITVVNETSIYVNDTVKVIVTVPSDATEDVTIEINGMKFTNSTINGNATFYIPEITYGNKTVVASYPGDDKYRFNSTTANFTVHKRQSKVNVTVEATTVGNNVTVNVEIPANATGYVIVNVDGTNYTVNTTNGVGSVDIKGLGNITHTVHVTYIGDDQYLPSENETTFDLPKANTTIAIAVESIDYGDSANITVTVEPDATGYITIKIDNIRNITLPVINGTVNWIVDDLAADNYTVYAEYSGDDKYNENNTDKDFEVRQISPEIKIISVISTAGENATIIVEIDPRTTENITVHVDKDYSVKPVNGIAIVTTDVLDYGNYTVNASYAGDKNFTKDYDIYEFTTDPTDDYLINITASDIFVGNNTNITVNVPSDATGKVIIELNGTNYTATISGGKAVLDNVSTLKAGVYDVTAYFGNDKYVNKTASTRFVVSKVETPITITVVNDTSILVGDTVKVIVTVPEDVTEDVTIEINGMEFTNSTVNGNATFYIPEITYGNKTVVATYPGDDKYLFNSTTAKFTVNKRDSYDIIVDVTEVINVGDTAQVNVTLPANATGQVVVKVDGQNYTINLTDGKGSVEIKGLLNGTYPVEVIYPGDDQYASSSNNTQEIKVNKVASTVTVNVDNITVGDVAAVKITVITNATGNVTIVIGDEYNKTVGVIDGEFSVIVPGLTVGDKTVNVTYNGDDKFLPSENSTNFTVGKTTAGINLVVENITYGEVETIIAFVNATGNVTFKLEGYPDYVVDIVEGKAEYPIKLDAGNYTVEVVYNGNTNTNSTSAKANFTVAKADPTVIVEAENIVYGDIEHIVIHVNAEGNVTVIINGTSINETIPLDNGEHEIILRAQPSDNVPSTYDASLIVHNLNAGFYTVEVTYNGNENFNKGTADDKFIVYKANTTVDVEVEPIVKVGETQLIKITVNNTNVTGAVVINVDGVNHTVNLTNGTANLTVDVLTSGNHSVVAIYEGDNNFNGNWTSTIFEAIKNDIEITLDATTPIQVGSPVTFTATLNETVTGDVVFTINGANYTVPVSNSNVATYEYIPVNNETLTVVATFAGNDKYNKNSTTKEFPVDRIPTDITISVEEPVVYGDAAPISIKMDPSINATVKLVIDDKSYNVAVVDGKGEFNATGLSGGDHVVNVTFAGDDKYLDSNNSTTFTVSKAQTDLKVFDLGNGTVVVVVPDDATGTVEIKVGNNTYNATVEDGIAVIDLVNETPGTYDIEVTYSGDENYTAANTTATATIPKLETPIKVTTENILVGDKENIVVTVPDDAKGNVTIEINGVKYTEEIKDGKAVFEIENLTYGNKTVYVDYVGDNNYTGNHTSANFTVDKRKSSVEVEVQPISVGETAVITVTVPANATGWAIVEIDNQTYAVNVTGGTGTLEIEGLASGDYPINVTYEGDDQYFSSTNATSLKVSKVPSSINVTVDDITVGENAVINIETPEDVCGNVTVSVDGENYTVPVSGGKGTLVVPDLKPGDHTVDVTFDGCKKYEPSQNSTTFTVSKAQTEGLKVIDQGNGTVVVVVPDNATGTVEIKVGNNTYNATVEDGIAVIDLVNETPGTYDIEVFYSGDDNHTAANTTGTATIPKLDTPIKVITEDSNVGDTNTIVVEVPDDAKGNVTIEIDGVKYTEEIKDGKATFVIENLTAGNKTVAVDYVGDNNYTGNHTTANFTVSKVTPEITVSASDSKVGDKVVIEVTAPADVTRPVLVDVGGKGYYVNITDGKGTLEIDDLLSGDYNVSARYLGDDKYKPANATDSFKVDKVPSTVTVEVDDITVGDKAIITVTVPEDATGNVTVTVDGKDYTVPVSGGKGTLVVPDLKVGTYDVSAVYNGDDKYESSNNSTEFEVLKQTTDDLKVIDQGNGTVVVVVPDNATGTVEIKVGNNTYNATVKDGVAVIDLVNETPGVHDIEVFYSGDENHTAANTTGTATIHKIKTPISVDVEDCNVGDTAKITVNVPEDATGSVTIEIDGVKYTSEIKDGKATFEVPNLTAGTKTIAVDYAGDDTYLPNHTTANITVSKVTPEITVSASDSKVGDKVVIEVTAPADVTRPVLVDVGGKGYYVNITDGKGTLEIDDLLSGDYDVSARYLGDDKYKPANASDSFKVDKVPSTITVEADDITVGDNAIITVTVPEDATGNVTITVDGKDYTVPVSGGKGTLVVPDLKVGTYDVSAVYNGDDKYESSNNSTEFEVLKQTTDDIKVIDQGNGTVVVIVDDNATGTVEIKVGNNTYNATVKDGVAVIDITNETPGTHDIEVIYSGDDTHQPQAVDSEVTIPKYSTPISVDVSDINVGDTAVVTVTLPDDATGSVTIEINGKSYTSEVKDGKAVFNVDGLEAGNKTVAVKYDGDNNYVENSTTGQFTVSKCPSNVTATGKDIKVGKDEIITATVPSDATGRVLVDIDGVGYYGTIVNGKAKIIIPELPSGKYTAKVTYEGDDKYLPSTTTTHFTVTKVSTPISATGDEIDQGSDATVVVKLPEDATGTVTITVDGKKYTSDVKNGKAVFTIPGLTKGDHDVSASYSGDKKYEANDTVTDILVHYKESPNPHNGEGDNAKPGSVNLTKYPTGNPILVMLLILLLMGSTQIRRFRK